MEQNYTAKPVKTYKHKHIWTLPIASVLLVALYIFLVIAYIISVRNGDEGSGGEALGLLILLPVLLLGLAIAIPVGAASIAITAVGLRSMVRGIRITNLVFLIISCLGTLMALIRLFLIAIY